MTKPEITRLFLKPTDSIQAAIARIDQGQRGIALIVDERQQLIGTVVDGDIRRALLAGLDLNLPVTELLSRKPPRYQTPISASIKTDRPELVHLMRLHSVRQIPLVDETGAVVDVFQLDSFVVDDTDDVPMQAVVMAGGFGTRLRPLTDDLPKPMLPVGDRPLMERIINQLTEAGIKHVNVTTHYMPEKIKDYFGDGERFGVQMSYVAEDRPLGTAGGVGLIAAPKEPLLVINGDILTNINFRNMLTYHREHDAALTVAVRKFEYKVPYGVVETDNGYVTKLVEKPSYTFFVNAGIYLLEPRAHALIPPEMRFDMTDLIDRLLAQGERVASFPIREYWLDIGQPSDYERAQRDVESGAVQ